MAYTQTQLDGNLLDAVFMDDLRWVKESIAAGANVNAATGQGGNTALHIVADHTSRPNAAKICETLLNIGADITIRNKAGQTPLHKAAMRDNIPVATAMLEVGANPNIRNADEWTPLHSALAAAQYSLAKLLLEAGADVNAVGTDKQSPLRKAMGHHPSPSFLCVYMLLTAGATITPELIDDLNRQSAGRGDYLKSILDGTTKRPTPTEACLDMEKRNASLTKLGLAQASKPVLGKYTNAAEHQRQAALDDPEQGI